MFYRILPYLFLSDLQSANELSLNIHENIRVVVSLGCVSNHVEGVEYLELPSIQDDVKVFLLSIWDYTTAFIHEKLSEEKAVLIHCVYGQSRSVSTIIAYLLRHCKFTLPLAIELIQSKKSDISINPGFLSQLYFLQHCLKQFAANDAGDCRGMLLALYDHYQDYLYTKHLTTSSQLSVQTLLDICNNHVKSVVTESECDDKIAAATGLYCRYCKTFLSDTNRILTHQLNDEVLTFLDTYVDDFWRHSYRRKKPTKKSKGSGDTVTTTITIPVPEHYIIAPPDWILRQQQDQQKARGSGPYGGVGGKQEIHCPKCQRVVGEWKGDGLTIIGDLFPIDYCALSMISVFKTTLQ